MRNWVLIALGAATLAGCQKKEEAPASPAANARVVRVVEVAPRALSGVLSATGPLTPREEATVSPEVTGFRVARVLVDQGAYVRKGQTLVQLDGALLSAQIDQQVALAAQAAIQAERAEAEAARVRGMDTDGALSKEEVEGRQFAARAARATANAQAAALREMRTRGSKLSVTSPVGGLVLERSVRPGDMSAGGGDQPWFRLARDGLIEVQAQLSDSDLPRVRVGQPATVTLPDGSKATGSIRLISPDIDPQTRLGEVRVSLPVRSDIRAGGFARVEFAGASGAALAVPEAAIRYDADGASVMVVGADNKVRQVEVKTGARGAGYVELVTGPPAGSMVLEKAAALVLPGELVRPTRAGAPAPKPAAAK